jgi:hypothetical protein
VLPSDDVIDWKTEKRVLVLMNADSTHSECPPACGQAAAVRHPSGAVVLEKPAGLGLQDRDEITHRHERRELLLLRARESSRFGSAGKLLDSQLDGFGCSELRELFGHLRRKTGAYRLEEFIQDALGRAHGSIIAKSDMRFGTRQATDRNFDSVGGGCGVEILRLRAGSKGAARRESHRGELRSVHLESSEESIRISRQRGIEATTVLVSVG